MKKESGSVFAIAAVLGAAYALGVTSIFTPIAGYAQESSTEGSVDTAPAVAAADWAESSTITIDEQAHTFRFQSNGIPAHGFAEQYLIPNDPSSQPFADNAVNEFTVVDSAEYFTETEVDTVITTRPTYVNEPTDTSLGRIGVAISGAQIFNDYEHMARSVVAMDDNVIHEHVPFVDACKGHTLVDGTNYHYHGIPGCITEGLDQEGKHSIMIGVLEDGFPVYANQGQSGVIVMNADLDECSGHIEVTPEFLEGIYHYHLTADEAPYMVDCYHGEIEVSVNGGGQGGSDFAAVAAELGVSEHESDYRCNEHHDYNMKSRSTRERLFGAPCHRQERVGKG